MNRKNESMYRNSFASLPFHRSEYQTKKKKTTIYIGHLKTKEENSYGYFTFNKTNF